LLLLIDPPLPLRVGLRGDCLNVQKDDINRPSVNSFVTSVFALKSIFYLFSLIAFFGKYIVEVLAPFVLPVSMSTALPIYDSKLPPHTKSNCNENLWQKQTDLEINTI
jgi:hypothetical protein